MRTIGTCQTHETNEGMQNSTLHRKESVIAFDFPQEERMAGWRAHPTHREAIVETLPHEKANKLLVGVLIRNSLTCEQRFRSLKIVLIIEKIVRIAGNKRSLDAPRGKLGLYSPPPPSRPLLLLDKIAREAGVVQEGALFRP